MKYVPISVVLIAWLTNPAHAQTPATPVQKPAVQGQQQASLEQLPLRQALKRRDQITTFRTESRLVLVDVVVKEKGKFLRGLRQEDFVVKEDGKPQDIVSISEGGSAGRKPPSQQFAAGIFSSATAADHEAPVTIFLLDALNTEHRHRELARTKLLAFLENAPEGHIFAVMSLTTELRLLQTFTTSKVAVAKVALNQEASATSPPAPERHAHGIDRMAAMGGNTYAETLRGTIEAANRAEASFQAQQTTDRVRITANAMKIIARYADRFPGRKALVWLSAAFPLFVPEPGGITNFDSHLHEATRALNNSQTALYPVDVRGIGRGQMYGLDDPAPSGRGALHQQIARGSAREEFFEFYHPQETMRELAELTGGRAFYNRNDLESAIAAAVEDNQASYTLGYYPSNRNYDGRYRKLSVTLRRSGVEVRHRAGYLADDFRRRPIKKATDADSPEHDLLVALESDPTTSSQVEFIAKLNPERLENGKPGKIDIFVPGRTLQFVDNDRGQYLTDTSFGISVLPDPATGNVAFRRIETRYSGFSQKQYQRLLGAGGVLYSFPINLKRGSYRIRLGIRDNHTRRIGTLEIPLTIP